jgi:hypothetical protein
VNEHHRVARARVLVVEGAEVGREASHPQAAKDTSAPRIVNRAAGARLTMAKCAPPPGKAAICEGAG